MLKISGEAPRFHDFYLQQPHQVPTFPDALIGAGAKYSMPKALCSLSQGLLSRKTLYQSLTDWGFTKA